MMKLTESLLEEAAFVADTTCTACLAEFLDAEDLYIHVRQMHPPTSTSLHCQLCSASCSDSLDYAAHVRDAHLFDLRCCRYCSKVFLNGTNLKMHQEKHTVDDTLYSCSQCSTMFSESVLLEQHEHRTHDNDEDGVVLKCMTLLSSILNLKAVSLLQSIGKKVLTCSVCDFKSVNLETYIDHLKVKKCEGFVCDRCCSVFKGKKYLVKHLKYAKKCKSIGEYLEELAICIDCNKAVHPKAMMLHKKNCSALKCIECNIICQTIDALSEHQTKEHPLGMNFIRCKFCSKEVIGEAPLKKHVDRVHRPHFHLYKYQCRECKAIFKHPQKLFAHFFTTHKELKPFNCKICNKSFRVRKSFSLHIKLDHKSVGFVEFDDQYHVFFSANKSEKPFVPECVLPAEDLYHSESEENKDGPPADSQRSDTDATNAETEDDTKEIKRKLPAKQIKAKRTKKTKNEPVLIYSSDEEPLLMLRKRTQKKRPRTKRTQWSWKKNMTKSQFMCEICHKNCYTYQNHQNHMNTHSMNQELECVKCSQRFNSHNELTRHMQKEHATSKLTETLKNLLQKKKKDMVDDSPNSPQTLGKSDKFTIVMKRVKIDKCKTSATIKPVKTDLSVKNFIENFTPEVTDTSPKEIVQIHSTITVKAYKTPFHKESTIKMTKFKDFPTYESVPLKMPQRFKQYDNHVKTKISIKLVETPIESHKVFLPETDHNYLNTFQDHMMNDDNDNDIPEMAHEISLVGTEEPEKPVQPLTRIVIPKMPKGYSKIHIATLQPEAPFFKIIKIDSDKLMEIKKKEGPSDSNVKEVINLPGGTRLVTANPLAHLLGQGSLDSKITYKPAKDLQGILAQAMQKLEEAPAPKKRKPRTSKQNQETQESSKVLSS